jgi:hypothetical protein
MSSPLAPCLYRNSTSQMVILRCIGPEPFESCLFSCPTSSRVDIWTHGLSGAELLDSIEAAELCQLAEASAKPAAEEQHDQA